MLSLWRFVFRFCKGFQEWRVCRVEEVIDGVLWGRWGVRKNTCACSAVTIVGRKHLVPCSTGIWIRGIDVSWLMCYFPTRRSILRFTVYTNKLVKPVQSHSTARIRRESKFWMTARTPRGLRAALLLCEGMVEFMKGCRTDGISM